MRRAVIAGVAAALAAGLVWGTLHIRREREWAHGGDKVKASVEIEAATRATFPGVAERLGLPSESATYTDSADQAVVVRVTWSGAPGDGRFQVVALDGRVTPPRVLAADGGLASDGETGSNWAGAYEVLADRYDWLSGVAAANYTDASGMNSMPTAAVGAPATTTGTVSAWFHQFGDGPLPFRDVEREVVIALIHVDDSGEVRWARQIAGQRPTNSNR